MIGDKVLITKNDILKARSLTAKILSDLSSRSIITIGGGSGTHKTELGIAIQEELFKRGRLTILVSLDDYYKIHFNLRAEERKANGIKSVGKQEINWVKIIKIIERFRARKKLYLEEIDKYANTVLLKTIDSRGIDYLIVEGLYANYLKKFKMSNLAIHLEGSPEDTLKFRKKRKKENEEDEFRKRVVEREYEEVEKLKRFADIIL